MHHMHTRNTHSHTRRRKSKRVCACVCVFGYRTCHSVNRNFEMQAEPRPDQTKQQPKNAFLSRFGDDN